jgi:protein-disulfide isomerase
MNTATIVENHRAGRSFTALIVMLIASVALNVALAYKLRAFVAIQNRFMVRHAQQQPVLIPHWRDHLGAGVRIGSTDAPVQLIEFADFECPFCGSFHKAMKALRERYPSKIAFTYVYFPLPMHRFAEPAARVAECAGDQGRFEAMHDLLFEQQDKFGFKPWSEFATEAGVADSAAFNACIKRTEPMPGVTEGKALGKLLDVQGTPTVVVNGWKLGRPPTLDEMDHMVKSILAGKSPIG